MCIQIIVDLDSLTIKCTETIIIKEKIIFQEEKSKKKKENEMKYKEKCIYFNEEK